MSTPKSARASLEAKLGKPAWATPSEETLDLMAAAQLPSCPKCAGTGAIMPRDFFIDARGLLYLTHGITEPILLRHVGIGPDRPGVKAATPVGTRPEIAVLTLRMLLVAVNKAGALHIVKELASGGKPAVDVAAFGDEQEERRAELFRVLWCERPPDYFDDVLDLMEAAGMPPCGWCLGAQSVITSGIFGAILEYLKKVREIPASMVARMAGVTEAVLSRRRPGGINASDSLRSDLTHAALRCLIEAEGAVGAAKVFGAIVADSKVVKP